MLDWVAVVTGGGTGIGMLLGLTSAEYLLTKHLLQYRAHGTVTVLSKSRMSTEEFQIAQAFANNGARVCESIAVSAVSSTHTHSL